MRALIDTVFRQLREYFGRLSKKERRRLFLLVLVVIILAVTVTVILGRTGYAELYSGLSAADAGDIIKALDEMSVPYKTAGTGTIYVPEDRVSDLRMTLASENYLSTGFDFSILQNAGGFGVTDQQWQAYYAYQQGELIAQQIKNIKKIQNCSVILNLQEDTPFFSSQDRIVASASVLLSIKGGEALTNAEANIIAKIVKDSVPGLEYENIGINDDMMNFYSIGEGNMDIGADVGAHFTLENQLQQQIQQQVEQLLTPWFGAQNINASASVTLNFDKEVSEAVVFEPPVAGELGGIVVSMMEEYENSRVDGTAEGIPGTDTNGMGTTEYPYGTLQDGELYNRVLRENNYEINKTVTQIEKAQGTVKSMSVAILIDEEAASEDVTARVQNAVSKAIGVTEEYIAVEQVTFVEHGETIEDIFSAQAEIARQMRIKSILEQVLMWGVILLLGLSVISLIKMVIKGIIASKNVGVAIAGGGIDYLADGDGINDLTKYDDVDLNAKPEGVEQLEKFIDKDPKAVAQLLRNWLTEE